MTVSKSLACGALCARPASQESTSLPGPGDGVSDGSSIPVTMDQMPHRTLRPLRSCLAGLSRECLTKPVAKSSQIALASPGRPSAGLLLRPGASSMPSATKQHRAAVVVPSSRCQRSSTTLKAVRFERDIDVDGRTLPESSRQTLSVPEPVREEVVIHSWKKLGPIAWYQNPGTLAACDDCEKSVPVAEGSLHGGKHGLFTVFTRPMFSCHSCLRARGYTEEMLNRLSSSPVDCRSCSKCKSPLMDGKVRWRTDKLQVRRPCCHHCWHDGSN